MVTGASTPEELETLFEDAFVMCDPEQLSAIYADGAVLVADRDGPETRGADAIGRAATALSADGRTYVAASRRVVQTRGTALVMTGGGVHVLGRAGDGSWRFVISLLDLDDATEQEQKS